MKNTRLRLALMIARDVGNRLYDLLAMHIRRTSGFALTAGELKQIRLQVYVHYDELYTCAQASFVCDCGFKSIISKERCVAQRVHELAGKRLCQAINSRGCLEDGRTVVRLLGIVVADNPMCLAYTVGADMYVV